MYIDRLPNDVLVTLKNTEQNLKWHPEKTVYNHIFLVEKEARKYDVNLEMVAVFHDLGKPECLQMRGGRPVFYGHEFKAKKFIEEYKHLFDDLDVNWDMVAWICRQHMKSHLLDKMRPFKREEIVGHEWFPYLLQFSDCDNNGRLPVDEIDYIDGS